MTSTPGRLTRSIVLSALAGDVAITAYLVIERAIASHVPLAQCLLELMQWDASNAYGVRAFAGGWATAGIGQLMDLVVSLGWATLFVLCWARFAALHRATWAWGLAYGVLVMIVMLYLVVPLGHAQRMDSTPAHILNVLIAHSLFFGLPLAMTSRFLLDVRASGAMK